MEHRYEEKKSWKTASRTGVDVIRLVVGELDTNCYVLTCRATKSQAIIDPGGDAWRIIDVLDKPELILLTHCHFDHTGALEAIREKFHIPSYCHVLEPCELCDRRLKEGDKIKFGNIFIEVLHTPGHTPGGVCYKLGNMLFSGDTIFAGAMGATHFPGGDFETLIRSIRKIFVLPDDTMLLPGHGPKTTVGHERASGFYPEF